MLAVPLCHRYDASGRRTWEIGRIGAVSPYRATTRTTWRAADDQPTLVETGRINGPDVTILAVAHSSDYRYNDRRLMNRERLRGEGTVFAQTHHSFDERNRRICSATRMNPPEFNSMPGSACDIDTGGGFGPDRVRRTTYDALSRPTRIVGGYRVLNNGAGNVEIELGYTANGQVEWRKDGMGNQTDYAYDGHDRLSLTTFPDDSDELLTYDSRSNITGRRTRSNRQITYAYDGAGRLTQTSYSNPGVGENPTLYDYDGQGREVEIERPGTGADYSLILITYDALGRRASESQNGRTVAWQYDIAGRPTRLTWPDAFYVTYDHSPAAQLTAIRDSAGVELIGFDYNVNGWLRGVERPNGLDTVLAFDPVGRVSRVNNQGLVYSDFTYNPASQIVTRELSNAAWAFDEDINVNLTYDRNNLNQYTEVGTTDFDYDLNGNLTNDGFNGYSYDPENRMLSSARDGGGTVNLRYDGRGRLRRRTGAGTTDYLYDGDAMIAEYNSAGAVLRRYIHGAGVDDPLIWYEGATTADRRFLHADERGSITTVTNNAGGIIARNIYDEWGVPGAGNIGRFQYTGQQWLPEIGLYYYKARMYAPGLGRFMQSDPVGYEAGMNLYAYVGNDPMNMSDPSGTCPFWACKGTSVGTQGEMEVGQASGTRVGSIPRPPSRDVSRNLERAIRRSPRDADNERGGQALRSDETGEIRYRTGREAGRGTPGRFEHLPAPEGETIILFGHEHTANRNSLILRERLRERGQNAPGTDDQQAMRTRGVPVLTIGPNATTVLFAIGGQDYIYLVSGDRSRVPNLESRGIEWCPSDICP